MLPLRRLEQGRHLRFLRLCSLQPVVTNQLVFVLIAIMELLHLFENLQDTWQGFP